MKKGSILVESIVAINVVVVGLLGVLGLLSNSLALNRDVGQQLVATYLATEGVEVVKNLIDTNYVESKAWNEGIEDGVYTVNFDSNSLRIGAEDEYLRLEDGIYSYETGEQTFFKRDIKIENISSDEIKVVSSVIWLTKKGVKRVDMEDHFFNWR